MKRMILTITAIILALLICWANFYVFLKTGNFMHAGGEILIWFGGIILLHALLLFVLIQTIKLPWGYMLLVWSAVIVLYMIPPVKYVFYRIERHEGFRARDHILEGVDSTEEFYLMAKKMGAKDTQDIYGLAIDYGYLEIAKEILDSGYVPLEYISFDISRGYCAWRDELNEDISDCLIAEGVETAYKRRAELLLVLNANWADFESVKNRIEAGVDINAVDRYGKTALIAACNMGGYQNRENYPIIARFLIENGADVNLRLTEGTMLTSIGEDAIYNAVRNNETELVKLLIEYGATTENLYWYCLVRHEEEKDEWGYGTLLGFAQKEKCNSEIIELLTRH